jgi:hypothetical protein
MKSSSVKDKGSVFMGRSYGVCLAIDTRIGASLFMSRAKAQPSDRPRREYAGSGGGAFDISGFKTALEVPGPQTVDSVKRAAFNYERTSCISGAEVESTPSALLIRRCGTIKRRGSK